MAICNNKKCSLGECDQSETCAAYVPVLTRADKIRAMSDEELAKFIDDIAQSVADGEYCTAFLNVKNFPYSCKDTKKACVAHVVDWLQQPAEVSE